MLVPIWSWPWRTLFQRMCEQHVFFFFFYLIFWGAVLGGVPERLCDGSVQLAGLVCSTTGYICVI